MFNTGTNYSLSDIAAVTDGNRDGMFGGAGGGAWWIIILFLFCFAGGWGNGGFGRGGNEAVTDVGFQLDMQSLQNGQNCMNSNMLTGFGNTNLTNQKGFCDVVQNGMQNTFALSNQLNNMAATQAQCCCENKLLTENKFAELNYNLATQACAGRQATNDGVRDIIENNNNNSRAIIDFLTKNKIDDLTTENAVLRGQISQENQNAFLLQQLKPCPQPSYLVQNPYTAACGFGNFGFPFTTGWNGWNNLAFNGGCGCNNFA